MSDTIVTVENLGKKYRIRHQAEGRKYVALRDVIAEKARGVFKKLKNTKAQKPKSEEDVNVSASRRLGVSSSEDFWALKDVSFEVKRGEVVGIIGRNGAGKSTLLKILSRITEPTEGEVRLRGRVASLLEVGTGFHPELTGRENIFLNGAILGMHRAEIKRKFDEIVAFAEVEKFLDTPVKRYSSGMYVRLAFAVAAHLEPEILIVDEVLAVGDAEFQKKCLGKMQDVAKGGRTVLFVSHNLSAVQTLCKSCILLDRGRLVAKGNVGETVSRYLQSDSAPSGISVAEKLGGSVFLARIEATPPVLCRDNQMVFTIEIGAHADEVVSDLALLIYATTGERVAIIDLRSPAGVYRIKPNLNLHLQSKVMSLPLVEADYQLGLWINSTSVCQCFMNLMTFTILPSESVGGVVPREPQHRGFVELQTEVKVV